MLRCIRYSSTLAPWRVNKNNSLDTIVNADGSYIYTKNKKIVDFTSGSMVVNLGHNNKYIQKGFTEYMSQGFAYVPSSLSTYNRELLSDRLLDVSNMDNGKVFYTNAGADSNEIASFITKEYNYYYSDARYNKTKIISFSNSFHGASTKGSSILSGDSRTLEQKKFIDTPIETIMENPSMHDNGTSSLNQIKTIFKTHKYICAILIEGSSGSAGCILYPPNYLKKLEKLCKDHDILIICDEVMSGFCRTGPMFAHFKQDIKPDIITCAKGLTCGYTPLGAVIINSKVSSVFNNNPIMAGLTYSGHPLGCLIANKCLDLYLENNMELTTTVNNKGLILKDLCTKISLKYSFIKEYRNNGLLGCFELNLNQTQIDIVSQLLLNNGIYCVNIRNNIFTAPPLTITTALLVETIHKIDSIFETYQSQFLN
jgi:taurine---2-oxoglutarate transaminase